MHLSLLQPQNKAFHKKNEESSQMEQDVDSVTQKFSDTPKMPPHFSLFAWGFLYQSILRAHGFVYLLKFVVLALR